MTAEILCIGVRETVLASDTAVYDENRGPVAGAALKFMPLPHLGAVLAGGTWLDIIREVQGEILRRVPQNVAELQAFLPGVLRRRYDETRGLIKSPTCAFSLHTFNAGWLYAAEWDFEPRPFSRSVFTDPPVDGVVQHPQPLKGGDRQIVRLMRKQRAQWPERYIGGRVIRCRLRRQSMEIAVIGDLEAPK